VSSIGDGLTSLRADLEPKLAPIFERAVSQYRRSD
jgi:hypothetical protein